jgi:hypothetical protein
MDESKNDLLESLIEDFAKRVVSNPDTGVVCRDEDGRGVTEADIFASRYMQRVLRGRRRALAEEIASGRTYDVAA